MNTDPLSLYIHWPFCVSKCPYCDFNSHVRKGIDETQWQQAYVVELERYRQVTGPRPLRSIFFGGGTPSLMQAETVALILNTAQRLWTFMPGIEITLEANPNSVEVEKFQSLAAAGINRVSIGIQSLRAEDLKFLGRAHSVDEGKRAIETAQKCFERVSFDLIYARPCQTPEAWERELRGALGYGTEHLSLYQLTIESGTAFFNQHARGDFVIPDEDEATDLYELTGELCQEKGLIDYEISNYARPGCESQHNLTYWRYGDYMGVGPGAHGRLTVEGHKWATKQYRAPETWLKNVGVENKNVPVVGPGGATEEFEVLDADQQVDEMLLMGLRLKEPFDLKRLPKPWIEILNKNILDYFNLNNMIDLSDSYVKLYPKARLCLNEVLRQLRS